MNCNECGKHCREHEIVRTLTARDLLPEGYTFWAICPHCKAHYPARQEMRTVILTRREQ